MKSLLLTFTLIIVATGGLFAQRFFQNLPPDYYWDIGFTYGESIITRPLGPANAYQGTRTNPVPDFSLRGEYTFTPRWHMILDIGCRTWQTTGTWKETGEYGEPLKSQNVTFLIAKPAVTESILMNYNIPFYNKFHTQNKANVYFGGLLGLVTTVNDGSSNYTKYNAKPDSNYTFLSRYDYGMGMGVSFGVQTGFNYYFLPRFGINFELAARYVYVGTNDTRLMAENQKFHLLYFPETIGIKYRFP